VIMSPSPNMGGRVPPSCPIWIDAPGQ